jgi:hypothetical protein
MLAKTDKTRSLRTYIVKWQFVLLLSILLAVSLGVYSCEGPVGPEGPQGPPGPPGAVGPAGEDGNMMLAGEGPPSGDMGDTGDFYLNLANGELYGPKDGQGWGEPVNLSGADGQDGADGSQIYAGDGPPDAELGSEGDYFLDKMNFHLYGPKTDEGWGMPLELQGPEGPPGSDGVSGWQRIVVNRTINAGENLTVEAVCPGGKVPVGGGFSSSNSLITVFQSYPESDRWIVRGHNSHDVLRFGLSAYAICVFAD